MKGSARLGSSLHRAAWAAIVTAILSMPFSAPARAELTGRWHFGGADFVDVTQAGNTISFTYQGISFSGTITGRVVDALVSPCHALRLVVSPDETRLAGSLTTGQPPFPIPCGPVGTSLFSGQRCECDDGNTSTGDGCDAECQVEECFACSGAPSACAPVGDGTPCDDGSACTSGETCNAGSCGAGSAVVPCIDMSGAWHVRQTSLEFGELHSTAHFRQIGSFLERGASPTGPAGYAGVIDTADGTFHLDGLVPFDPLTPLICGTDESYQVVDGSSPDGATFAGSGFVQVRTASCYEIPFDEIGSRCGGGTLDPDEACDDGNVESGDGCDPSCAIETCFECSGEPSACAPAGAGSPCDDGDPCTLSGCDGAGACTATGGEVPGTPCDDADPCTVTACDGAGECATTGGEVPGTPCDDGDPCTVTACDGAGACAVTGGEPSGTPCDDGDLCTENACDGVGTCAFTGDVVCADDDGPCTATSCLPSFGCVQQAISGPCDTGDVCEIGACHAGSCGSTGTIDCDDGHSCTTDSCEPGEGCRHEPALGSCRHAGASTLRFVAGASGAEELLWNWRRGEATSQEDLGHPLDFVAGYTLCVFAGDDLVTEAKIGPGSPRWSSLGPTSGFKYVDRDGAVNGLRRMVLRTGAAGKARIVALARAPGLDAAAPPYATPVTAQLTKTTGNPICWSSTFDAADVRRNDAARFTGRSSSP